MSLIKSGHIRVFVTALGATAAVLGVTTTGIATASEAWQTPSAPRILPVSMKVSPTPMPTIGQPAPEASPKAPVTLNSLHRTQSGLVTLTWTITNNGYSQYQRPVDWVGIYDYANAPASGITITDESAKIRYNPLRIDPDRRCMCTETGNLKGVQEQGDSEILFDTYKIPASVKSVTVNIPDFSPAKNIPIS